MTLTNASHCQRADRVTSTRVHTYTVHRVPGYKSRLARVKGAFSARRSTSLTGGAGSFARTFCVAVWLVPLWPGWGSSRYRLDLRQQPTMRGFLPGSGGRCQVQSVVCLSRAMTPSPTALNVETTTPSLTRYTWMSSRQSNHAYRSTVLNPLYAMASLLYPIPGAVRKTRGCANRRGAIAT